MFAPFPGKFATERESRGSGAGSLRYYEVYAYVTVAKINTDMAPSSASNERAHMPLDEDLVHASGPRFPEGRIVCGFDGQ